MKSMLEQFGRHDFRRRYRVCLGKPQFERKLKELLDDSTIIAVHYFKDKHVDILAGGKKIAKIPLIHSGGIGQIKTTENHCKAIQAHNGRSLAEAIEVALEHADIAP